MPHIIVEFSGNAEEWCDPARMTGAVHDALCACEHLPADAIKTRALIHEVFNTGQGGGGFATALIRTCPGSDATVLHGVASITREAISSGVAGIAGKTFSVSVEIQVVDTIACAARKSLTIN